MSGFTKCANCGLTFNGAEISIGRLLSTSPLLTLVGEELAWYEGRIESRAALYARAGNLSAETAADGPADFFVADVGVLMDLTGEYIEDAVGREAEDDGKLVWTLSGPFFVMLGA